MSERATIDQSDQPIPTANIWARVLSRTHEQQEVDIGQNMANNA